MSIVDPLTPAEATVLHAYGRTRPDELPDGVTWPVRHPESGEPFVSGDVRREREIKTLHYGPPLPPQRSVYDDDDVLIAELTDEEYAAATDAHALAFQRWQETGGMTRLAGPVHTYGTFQTATGGGAPWDRLRWTGGSGSRSNDDRNRRVYP